VTELYAEYTAGTPEDVARQVEEARTCRRAAFRARKRPQDKYILLPWSMEELPGTTWRNAYTLHAHTIKVLATDRWDRLGPDPDEQTLGMFKVGLWRDDRFCIEHWVRVDHLPARIRQAWAVKRVRYCRKELRRAQNEKASDACHKIKVQWAEDYLAEARQELAELTERLGLTLALDIRNVGATQGDQLALL